MGAVYADVITDANEGDGFNDVRELPKRRAELCVRLAIGGR